MAETSPSSADRSALGTRTSPAVRLGLLIAATAFGVTASGSVAVLGLLICLGLDLLAWAGLTAAERWSRDQPARRVRASAVAGVFQAGLALAASAFLAWEAVVRIFLPRPLMVGEWGVIAVLIVMAVGTVGVILAHRRAGSDRSALHEALSGEIAPSLVALIGVASATWLAAPGLDGSAALVIAAWLGWGAVSLLRASLRTLVEPDESAATTTGPWTR